MVFTGELQNRIWAESACEITDENGAVEHAKHQIASACGEVQQMHLYQNIDHQGDIQQKDERQGQLVLAHAQPD